MELVDKLERRFVLLAEQITLLKKENQQLRDDLDLERVTRQDVQARIERLLSRVQEEME